MKCSICGHKSRSLPAMAKHYRKKHPSKMKQRKKAKKARTQSRGKRFCPHCGGYLGS